MATSFSTTHVDREQFLKKYAEMKSFQPGRLMRLKMMTDCVRCKTCFGGPSIYQKIILEGYVCDACMDEIYKDFNDQTQDGSV